MDIEYVVSRFDWPRIFEIVRFYQAAAANAAFGFGMYSLLVWLGLNIFLAQIIAHCIGVAFNYFTYSRHVFKGAGPAKLRFVAVYAVNYFIGLCCLALLSIFIKSPYVAGFGSMVLTSIINYFLLKRLVFLRGAPE